MAAGTPRPKFTWDQADDGSLTVQCETDPTEVTLWQATNPDGRDFRLENVGKIWTSSPVEAEEAGTYRAALQAPEKGWTAFFLEMEFPNPDFETPFTFSTAVSVVPDVLPHVDIEEPRPTSE